MLVLDGTFVESFLHGVRTGDVRTTEAFGRWIRQYLNHDPDPAAACSAGDVDIFNNVQAILHFCHHCPHKALFRKAVLVSFDMMISQLSNPQALHDSPYGPETCDLVVKLMGDYLYTDPRVLVYGLMLAGLLQKSVKGTDVFSSFQMCDMIQYMVHHYPEDALLQLHCFLVIQGQEHTSCVQIYTHDKHMVPQIVHTMKRFPSNEKLQRAAVLVLELLCV